MEDSETMLSNLLYVGGAMQESPRKTMYVEKHYQMIIAIGNNHTATITVDEESLKELCKRENVSLEDFLEG